MGGAAVKKVRPIRIDGRFAYVPLTKGYEAIIDVEDVPIVEGWNWSASPKGGTAYAVRRSPSGHGRVRMHRVIMGSE